MSTPLSVIALAAGVALLIWGGDALVRGAVVLAQRLGVSPLVIGLTVVAFGTSAPELALNLIAAFKGNDGLSFGNIVGSNIANIGLILGITAMCKPLYVSSSVVKRELPLMLGATALMLLAVGVPPGVPSLLPGPNAPSVGEIGRWEAGLLLAAFLATLGLILRAGMKQRSVREKFEEEAQDLASDGAPDEPAGPFAVRLRRIGKPGVMAGAVAALAAPLAVLVTLGLMTPAEAAIAAVLITLAAVVRPAFSGSTTGATLSIIAGLAALVAGGQLTESGASSIARALGMSDELIGLTIVAIATSLPELATSLAAVRRGTIDIAVGNVVGSNIFNILLVMGATAAVGPVTIPPDGWTSLGTMALLSLLLLPMATIRSRYITRLEGVVLLGLYAVFMAWTTWAALDERGAPSHEADPVTPAAQADIGSPPDAPSQRSASVHQAED